MYKRLEYRNISRILTHFSSFFRLSLEVTLPDCDSQNNDAVSRLNLDDEPLTLS